MILRDPQIADYPYVCRKIDANVNGSSVKVKFHWPAKVQDVVNGGVPAEDFVPISKFRKAGLSKTFSKWYFTLKGIRYASRENVIGVARQGSSGNQEDYIDNLCVFIPIRSYNEYDSSGKLISKIRKSNAIGDCISFRTQVPSILVVLRWSSSDDLDLRVKEPDGNRIWYGSSTSKTGGQMLTDGNFNVCGSNHDGMEQIRWLKDGGSPLKGEYEVSFRHYFNCGQGETKWSLAVIINGARVFFQEGSSNGNANTVTLTDTFTY